MRRQLAVIFDMDGVILDSEGLIKQAWHNLGERDGLEGVDELLSQLTGVNATATAVRFRQKYGDDFPMDAYMRRMHEEMLRLCGGIVPAKPFAAQTLDALRDAGIPLALASSTSEAAVVSELSALGLYERFDVVVCGDMVTVSKPAPDIFLYAAGRLGVEPANCVVIEDSHNGIRAAHAAGMHPVMVPDRQAVTDEMRALAEAVVPTLAEVVPLVRSMLGA